MTKDIVESFLQERYVIFNTVAGISIMAIILEELEDSYIVGLPARLIKQRNVISAEPYFQEVVSRFYKHTLLNHVPLANHFEIPYLQYVVDNGKKIDLPDEEIQSLKEDIEALSASVDNDTVSLPDHVEYVFPETKEVH